MANERLTLQIDTVTTGTQQVDALTASLNKVVSIADRTGKSLQSAGSGNPFSNFPQLVKQSVEDPLGAAESAAVKFFGTLSGGAAATGGITIGLAGMAAASFAATKSLADLGVQTQAMSLKTGLSTKEVGAFAFAAKAAGGESEAFVTAMRKLSEGLEDGGVNGKRSAKALSDLGVATRTTSGELRPMGDIFKSIAERLSTVTEKAEQFKLLNDALGRGAGQLLPTLLNLNAHLKEFAEFGGGISEAEESKLLAYNDQLQKIEGRWDILVRKFKEGISGTFTLNFVSDAIDFLSGNKSSQSGPTVPSQFLIANPAGGGSRITGGPPWKGLHLPSLGLPDNAYSSPDTSTLTGFNNFFYGNLTNPSAVLGIGSPRAPGVPLEFTAQQSDLAASTARADALAKRRESGELGTPQGMTERIADLTAQRANLLAANLPGAGVGEATQHAADTKIRALDGQIAHLKVQQKEMEAVISQAADLKKRAQDVVYGDFPFTKLMDTLVGANKNPGSEAFGSALTIGTKVINDEVEKAQKLPLIYTPLIGALYRNQGGEQSALFPTSETGQIPASAAAGKSPFTGQYPDEKDTDLTRRAKDIVYDIGVVQAGVREKASASLQSTTDQAQRLERFVGIGAEPGDEIKIAREQLAIRTQTVDKEREILKANEFAYTTDQQKLDLAKKRDDLDKEAQDATIEYMASVAEFQAKQKEAARAFAGGLFDALTSHSPNAVPNYLKGEVLGIGKTITENAATKFLYPQVAKLIPHASDPSSIFGKLLGGTPFGASPLDKSAALLTTAGITLDAAGQKLLALSPSGGGGGIPSSSGIAAAIKAGSGLSLGSGSSGNFGTFDESSGTWSGIGSPPGDIGDGLPMSTATMSPMGALAKSSFGSSSLGKDIGLGVTAATGGFAAFNDFKSGGAKNDIAGSGALLGSAAAIAAMIPGGQIVALGLGIASAATSLISAFLPDPHVVRENAIQKAISEQTYHAPQALNVTESSSGTFADFDARGNLRTSNFSAVPTVRQASTWEQTHGIFGGPPTFFNVPGGQTGQFGAQIPPTPPPLIINLSAIDTQSGVDFLHKNHQAVGDAAATALQQSHARLATEVQRTAAG